MNQAVCVYNRKKRPQPECKKHKKHGKKDPIEKEILQSMLPEQRKKYFKKKHAKTAKRIEKRKDERIYAHELRLEASQRTSEKRRRRKARKSNPCVAKKVARRRKTPPSQETIARRRLNAERRLIQRGIKKIIAFAERNGSDPIKIIALLIHNGGAGCFKISTYQKLVKVS
ncbi:hypothetical protein MNBD_BACTEROID05-995 [hydrothermal vent metagenome]|uniref:Uncharacterized protein n=1 Tax=hydrothermal vent metagenome TaxID=652676 RepID=A0A3B0T3P3_9ZZZZ